MADNLPIVLKLQADAMNANVSVTHLLRTAKVVATKLGAIDALVWIDRELNGYMDLPAEDLPPYRRLSGTPRAFDPYNGWRPIEFQSSEHADIFSHAPIGVAIGALERDLDKHGAEGHASFPYRAAPKSQLMKALSGMAHDADVRIEYGALWNILDQVRHLVLNWTLELEKAGVLGEDMTFSEKEKTEAVSPSSQIFNIQNVGVLGPVNDEARVSIKQRAIAKIEIDLDFVRDFVSQAQSALPLLPVRTRSELEPLLENIGTELVAAEPDQPKLRGWLRSARTICEGAAGNLAASGIVELLKYLPS